MNFKTEPPALILGRQDRHTTAAAVEGPMLPPPPRSTKQNSGKTAVLAVLLLVAPCKVKVSSNNVRIVLLFRETNFKSQVSSSYWSVKNQSSFEQPRNQKAGFLILGMISTNRYNEGT